MSSAAWTLDVFRGSGDRVSPGAWTIEAVRGFGQSRQSEGLDNRGSPRVWTLAEFQRVFPDEASCAALLIARRSLEGSPALLVATLAPSPCRAAHACSNGSTAGNTDDAGRAMHRSKLPLATWFWAAHDSDAFQRHVGSTARGPARCHLQVGWAANTEAAPRHGCEPRSSRRCRRRGQNEIPRRVGNTFFEPGKAGKLWSVAPYPQGQPEPARRQVSRYALLPPVPTVCGLPLRRPISPSFLRAGTFLQA